MLALPIRLGKDPIVEAVFETRFVPAVPDEAVYGLVYSAIRHLFSNSNPLPIVNIPEEVRKTDPNLRYQAWHTFVNPPFRVNVGPRTILFANPRPYAGWEAWSTLFKTLLKDIQGVNVISLVERVGLRYINFFEGQILEHANVDLRIASNPITTGPTNIRTEIADGEFTKVLQIGNSVNATVENKPRHGSVIDVDCISNLGVESAEYFDRYPDILEKAHVKAKELFFELINGSLLEACEPEYEAHK